MNTSEGGSAHNCTGTGYGASTQGCPEHSPQVEARIIEFLFEWLVTFLMPASMYWTPERPTLISCF